MSAMMPVLELLRQQECFDTRMIQAEKHFHEQQYQKAFQVLKKMLDDDPYHNEMVQLYCCVLIELGFQGELYHIAHKLVQANPDSAVAWYAVGSYYFLIKKYP
mmetsp:Transcript_4306/g.7272  ORF Transcript_4306/g.7272 Transcript_4306/m.7272 type:complete len:103 (+) Transcript_4306:572-880(+)